MSNNQITNFFHDNGSVEGHRWHFVYLHGEAEAMSVYDDSDDCQAPDICVCDRPLSDFLICNTHGMPIIKTVFKMEIECTVNGVPALCVIGNRREGIFGGRIALLSDEKALEHVKSIDQWR